MKHDALSGQPAFDWLRFVLALLFLLGHEKIFEYPPFDPGHAVDVFLALSGWLIGGILLSTQVQDLPRFFYNRVTRVWLPYFVAVAGLYLFAALRDGIDAFWVKYLFFDLTFTHYTFTIFPQAHAELPLQGTGNHFWSISVEEQFYLMLPLGLALRQWLGRDWPWFVAVALIMLCGDKFLPIAFGVLAITSVRRYGDWHLTLIGRWGIRAVALGIGALFAAGYASIWLNAAFGVAVVMALAMPGRRSGLGQVLGGMSYPLYLNAWVGAFAANFIAKRLELPAAAHHALVCALAVLVAFVLWACVDRQILARRKGWYRPWAGQTAALSGYVLTGIGLIGGLWIFAP